VLAENLLVSVPEKGMHEMNHVVDTNKRLVEGGTIAAFEPTLNVRWE